jgi:hypothetical protein
MDAARLGPQELERLGAALAERKETLARSARRAA